MDTHNDSELDVDDVVGSVTLGGNDIKLVRQIIFDWVHARANVMGIALIADPIKVTKLLAKLHER